MHFQARAENRIRLIREEQYTINTELTEYEKYFEELWATAEAIWEQRQNDREFEGYVSADYRELLPWMMQYRDRATTFLEWGAGLGVMTIMASHLGYEAYGIEAEASLVDFCQELAEQFDADCSFAVGSFIPDAFCWQPSRGEEAVRTSIDHRDGYAALGMELRDFDLIYSYPWPTEHELYQNILRDHGAVGASLLTYDAREGVSVKQF